MGIDCIDALDAAHEEANRETQALIAALREELARAGSAHETLFAAYSKEVLRASSAEESLSRARADLLAANTKSLETDRALANIDDLKKKIRDQRSLVVAKQQAEHRAAKADKREAAMQKRLEEIALRCHILGEIPDAWRDALPPEEQANVVMRSQSMELDRLRDEINRLVALNAAMMPPLFGFQPMENAPLIGPTST